MSLLSSCPTTSPLHALSNATSSSSNCSSPHEQDHHDGFVTILLHADTTSADDDEDDHHETSSELSFQPRDVSDSVLDNLFASQDNDDDENDDDEEEEINDTMLVSDQVLARETPVTIDKVEQDEKKKNKDSCCCTRCNVLVCVFLLLFGFVKCAKDSMEKDNRSICSIVDMPQDVFITNYLENQPTAPLVEPRHQDNVPPCTRSCNQTVLVLLINISDSLVTSLFKTWLSSIVRDTTNTTTTNTTTTTTTTESPPAPVDPLVAHNNTTNASTPRHDGSKHAPGFFFYLKCMIGLCVFMYLGTLFLGDCSRLIREYLFLKNQMDRN